jgi:MtN3 and saliva related transmembrane protein
MLLRFSRPRKMSCICRQFAIIQHTILNMMAQTITSIGFAAGIITTFAFLPQVIQILRTKRTRDINPVWAIAMTAGVALWVLYGIETNDLPVMAANGITLILLLIILFCKFRYK